MGSSRFPGKPLAPILGMPMLAHCYHRTRLAIGANSTYIATCDPEIVNYIDNIGGTAVMTSANHTRATTRTAEALEHIEGTLGEHADVVIMIQGDEPLISPSAINQTLTHFKDPDINIVNIMARIKNSEQCIDKNNVKVVASIRNQLFFLD